MNEEELKILQWHFIKHVRRYGYYKYYVANRLLQFTFNKQTEEVTIDGVVFSSPFTAWDYFRKIVEEAPCQNLEKD